MDKNLIFKDSNKEILNLLLILLTSYLVLNYIHEIIRFLAVVQSFIDFKIYYKEVSHFVKNFKSLESYPNGLAYSPIFYILFYPFTLINQHLSLILWVIVNHIVLIASLYYLTQIFDNNKNLTLLISIIILTTSYPILDNIGFGQVNIFILFSYILSIHFYLKDKKYLVGLFLSFPILIKPQFALFFIFFLWKKEYEIIGYIILNYLLLRIIGIIFFTPKIELFYWKNLFRLTTNSHYVADIRGISIRNIIDKIIYGINKNYLFSGIVLYIILSIIFIIYSFANISTKSYNKTSFIKDFSILICLIAIISPLTSAHHLVLTVIPFVLLLKVQLKDHKYILALILSFCLISLKYSLIRFETFHYGFLSIFRSGRLIGVLILWWLLNNLSLDNLKYTE